MRRNYLAPDGAAPARHQVRRIQSVARELLRLGAVQRARHMFLTLEPEDLGFDQAHLFLSVLRDDQAGQHAVEQALRSLVYVGLAEDERATGG
jgi:hypothetical protein